MGFYVRKSLKAGPFRFNLSKSGLGISTGVPGFRVGSSPRGNYVRMGTRGVYYRSSLNPKQAKQQSPHGQGYPAHHTGIEASEIHFEDLTGALLQELSSTSADDLVSQLNQAAHRQPLTRWAVLAVVLIGLFTMPVGLMIWLLGVPLVWWSVMRDRARRSVVVFYDVNDQHAQHFESICAANTQLARVQGLWRVNESGIVGTVHQRKINAGAAALVRRASAAASDHGPRQLVTNISVPGVTAGSASLYFLPDRILLEENRLFTGVSYDALTTTARTERFIESPGPVPSDSTQVGTTWQYVNVKGGPDRRFSNNAVLPVMTYGYVELTTPAGLRWVLQISNTESSVRFAAALQPRPFPSVETPEQKLTALPSPAPHSPSSIQLQRPQASPTASIQTQTPSRMPRSEWIVPQRTVQVNGYTLPRGFIYIGTMPTSSRGIAEPALIDPVLPINHRHPDMSGSCLTYWPSYAGITPEGRAAFLGWLASNRRNPGTPIGYVFIYFYGLERRVLVDIEANPSLAGELPSIRTELVELLTAYGEQSGSFRMYASQFIAVIDFLLTKHDGRAPAAPALTTDKWPVPLTLRSQIGFFAASGTPIPAAWALAWAWYHPEIYLRTPAKRCPEEFRQLFDIRYRQEHPNGISVRPGTSTLQISYHAASSAIGSVILRMEGVPDVFEQKDPGRKLSALFDQVTTELDGYSRWLGRNPGGQNTLPAAALLPPELLEASNGTIDVFRNWLAVQLQSQNKTLKGADILNYWPSVSTDKLTKPEAVQLVQLLGHLHIGMEPDVRFGGPVISTSTPIVLFKAAADAPTAPTPSYSTTATMMHLGVAVAGSEGDVHETEIEQLYAYLESTSTLTPAEKPRIQAHLTWLCTTDVRLTGLTKRIDELDQNQRAAIGEAMIAVAAADGRVAAAEVSTIQKIYKLLQLDPETVTSRLHAGITTPAPSTFPVTVRPPGAPDTAYPLPPQPTATNGAAALDQNLINVKLAETAAVSTLLGGIFSEESTPSTPNPPTPDTTPPTTGTQSPRIGSLDASHTAFLRALADMEQLERSQFEDLAAEYGLLPDGALDVLNEAAIDASDEPLIEGDDILSINSYALEELLS